MKTPQQIYESAITDRDGTINVGYLFLFKVVKMFWVELSVMTLGASAAMYVAWGTVDDMVKVLSAYGAAVGIVAAANFVTALPGIAAFLWGDSHAAPAPGTIKTESSSLTKIEKPAETPHA